jgi:hypothetical protein
MAPYIPSNIHEFLQNLWLPLSKRLIQSPGLIMTVLNIGPFGCNESHEQGKPSDPGLIIIGTHNIRLFVILKLILIIII